MKVKSELVAGLAIFILTGSIFLASHVHQVADSRYSMLVSESLLHHRSFTLDHYVIPGLVPDQQIAPGFGGIYQLDLIDGHIYYYFPPGSSVLSVPYVAIMNVLGVSASNADGTYSQRGDRLIQVSLAAILMAALSSLIFFTSRFLLPTGWSFLIAFGQAFGTQIWSTASRALWSDTWGILLLGFVVCMLLAQEAGRHRIRPMLLASLLAWSYFVRPTNSIPILGISIYLFLFYRPLFIRYVAVGGLWLAAFVAYSWYHFGQVLPNYYLASRLDFHRFWTSLAANLISPSRGLLVFVPVIIFVCYLLIRYAKALVSTRLMVLSLTIITAHLIIISAFPQWWAGHSFGPRFTTGLVPWFALLSILAVKARLVWHEKQIPKRPPTHFKVEMVLGAILLACSVAINLRGATDGRTALWNMKPIDVDEKPERVWDWSDPQFLRRN
jgi:hypothetical protein